MPHAVPLALLLAALAACRGQPGAPPVPPSANAPTRSWAQPRNLRVASAHGEAGPALELRYRPADGTAAGERVALVVVDGERERTLWTAAPTVEQREALFGGTWALVELIGPPRRLAVSPDGGATFFLIRGQGGAQVLCPHEAIAAHGGLAEGASVASDARWAAEVLETAVWGCDEAGRHCQTRSLANLPIHHSEPGARPLAGSRAAELRAALATAASATMDRTLAVALVDAALGYQAGLDQAELETLGVLAAKGLAADGPLSPEERRALQLRVALGAEEARKAPADRLSPRVSIQALRAGLEGPASAIGH